MDLLAKPYVHISIDSVHAVAFDPEGRYDADLYDRYATFAEARDAALCCIEAMLDEADYDDEAHKDELLWMLGLLEPAPSFDDLERRPEYLQFLGRQGSPLVAAA